MTNKTTTLSRELADQIEIALGQVGKQDHLVDYALVAMTLRELRAALAEPVPPAGGDVEVLSYLYRHPTGEPWPRTYKDRQYGMTDWVETELVDRAHVTRLQAEVESLKKIAKAYIASDGERSLSEHALRAELTKARERVYELENVAREFQEIAVGGFLDDDHVLRVRRDLEVALKPKTGKNGMPNSTITLPLEYVERLIERLSKSQMFKETTELRAFLTNQSAPADKGQPRGALIRYREYVGTGEDGREIWHNWSDWSNTTVSFAESKLDQTRDLKNVQYEVEWLYAEQPAPVAVVMPEPQQPRGDGGASYYIPVGWNACLDEVARLNLIQQ